MTETRFTPGPWVSRGQGDVEAADGRAIGTTEGLTREDMANAHLIAAAPFMYRALENARERLRKAGLYREDVDPIEWTMRKARGEGGQ